MKTIISIVAIVLCLGVATSGFAADISDYHTPQFVKGGMLNPVDNMQTG